MSHVLDLKGYFVEQAEALEKTLEEQSKQLELLILERQRHEREKCLRELKDQFRVKATEARQRLEQGINELEQNVLPAVRESNLQGLLTSWTIHFDAQKRLIQRYIDRWRS
jgi:hypothetical protein